MPSTLISPTENLVRGRRVNNPPGRIDTKSKGDFNAFAVVEWVERPRTFVALKAPERLPV